MMSLSKFTDRSFENTKVYPGHMRETTIGGEKRAGAVMDYFR